MLICQRGVIVGLTMMAESLPSLGTTKKGVEILQRRFSHGDKEFICVEGVGFGVPCQR